MGVGSWAASADEDGRVHWSLVGKGSVMGSGVSLWWSAQDTEYIENGGVGFSIFSLMFL